MLVHTVFFWLAPDADRAAFERGLTNLEVITRGFGSLNALSYTTTFATGESANTIENDVLPATSSAAISLFLVIIWLTVFSQGQRFRFEVVR